MTDRIAVVGAGVVGCAVARSLATDHEVVVFERGTVAGGTTADAAGLVTMTPSYSDCPAIAAHADRFFRAYDGTGAFRYTERGSVELVPPDREGEARRRADRLAGTSRDVSFLDAGTVAERYPRIDTSAFAGAVVFQAAGWVDPYAFTTALQADAVERGVTFHTGATVEGVIVDDGAVTGLETESGATDADAVVAAAGWRTPDLLADVLELPVRPYRTQCAMIDPGVDVADLPVGFLPDEHVYWRPDAAGDLLVGGWAVAEDDPEGASRTEDAAFRRHVADLVPEILCGVEDVTVVDGWAGIDGATPDTRPVVDAPPDAPDGLVIATGFHGRGVMTAPVAAEAVRSLIAGVDVPFSLAPFSLDRFESRSRDFEFHSVSA